MTVASLSTIYVNSLTRLLIEYGADINVKNEEGQTALMLVKEAIMKDDADDGVILHSVGKLMELLGVSEKELRQWLEEKKSKAKSRKPRDEDLWD